MRQCDLTEINFQGSFGQREAHLMSLSQLNLLPLQRQAVCRRRVQDETPFSVDGAGACIAHVIRHSRDVCHCKGYAGLGGLCYSGPGGSGEDCPSICR